jgi:hypothetical protein
MNRIINKYYPIFEEYQALRNKMMEILDDADLGFRPGGDNLSLGALCLQIGEVEQSYIQSFRTFRQDFSYRNEEPGLHSSTERLKSWFRELDIELKSVIEALSEHDINNRAIDRGGDFRVRPQIQLDIYKEALLIFYGKVDVYLKALGKERPEQWQEWIA